MTVQLGKVTTAEEGPNGIVLRHLTDHRSEFFVGLPAEEALLTLLQKRKEAREAEARKVVIAEMTELLSKGDLDGAGALAIEHDIDVTEDIVTRLNESLLVRKFKSLKGQRLTSEMAHDFADDAAMVILAEDTLVSWDGIDDDLFEFVTTLDGDGYKVFRPEIQTIDDVNRVVLKNVVATRRGVNA